MKKVTLLANEFSRILNEWLPKKIYEINLRNKEDQYIGFCATHDFCDPNQAMIDAFVNIFGKEPSPKNQKHCDFTNEAWTLAKSAEFKPIITIWNKTTPAAILEEFTDKEGTFLIVKLLNGGEKLCINKLHTHEN